jgi:pyruvate dehydrogenase E2 component (dihydrolipoamide acetyltransferase)
MSAFVMPSLGADMEAGTLVEWLKQPGDHVERGDVVAVVETQKGAIEIEIFQSGVLEKILVQPGQEVPVGTPLAQLRTNGEAPAETPPPKASAPVASTTAPPVVPAPRAAPPLVRAAAPRPRITPAARRRAGDLGLDPAQAVATGPDGAITLADVERLVTQGTAAEVPVASAPVAPTRRTGFDPDAMRQAIAAAMARSKREIPHYYLSTTIDLTSALDWLARANAERSVTGRLLAGVLLLKAVALALREQPGLNGFWKDRFMAGEGIHVGWAIALRGGGLVAPAVHDADRHSLDDLMDALRDLVRRARSGGLRSSEMTDPTITVTSLGEQGVEAVQGVIYPPQVAIVGFGTIGLRPWVHDGRVAARQLVTASLAADHRASDGHRGGLLLRAIDRLLQEPEAL